MLEKYLKARVAFIQLCDAAHSTGAKKFWERRLKWCEKKIVQTRKREIEQDWRKALMKRLKFMVIIVNVAVILSIVGCQTLKGGMGDAAWLLQKGADNINTEGK